MTFAAARIKKAIKLVASQGYDTSPGNLVCVLHPQQTHSLLGDSNITQAMQFGGAEPIREGQIPKLYGVDLVQSTKVPTGTGAGTPPATTYHAFVFSREALGLGVSRNLLIESQKKTDERKLVLTASHRIAAAAKTPKAVVKIITA